MGNWKTRAIGKTPRPDPFWERNRVNFWRQAYSKKDTHMDIKRIVKASVFALILGLFITIIGQWFNLHGWPYFIIGGLLFYVGYIIFRPQKTA